LSFETSPLQKSYQKKKKMSIANPATLIEFGLMRFLIFDAPSDSNLPAYIKEFEKYNVTDVVRLCYPTYDKQPLESHGITVHELPFGDGDPPPDKVIEYWIKLYESRFYQNPDDKKSTIGVHCVAGLGRAPVLVAIALIEKGMSPLDSVEFIRKKRRGAINNKQLKYIEHYKRHTGKGCIVM